jgi:hypothetical protein
VLGCGDDAYVYPMRGCDGNMICRSQSALSEAAWLQRCHVTAKVTGREEVLM